MPSKRPTPRPERGQVPVGVLFRMFVLGLVGVVASGYALYRYYFVPRPSMLVPAPAPSELDAPELEPSSP